MSESALDHPDESAHPPPWIQILQDEPSIVLRISTKDMTNMQLPRTSQRKRVYQRMSSDNQNSDDDLVTDSDDLLSVPGEADAPANAIDAPPPGFLHTLWYSLEEHQHVWVLEKCLAWKTRSVVTTPPLDPEHAHALQQRLLSDPNLWNNTVRRMDVSRLAPQTCPIVHAVAHVQATEPAASLPQREEVVLVKWRGRSHMHCSWERVDDLLQYDGNPQTLKHKLRRFEQTQTQLYGTKDWRERIEEERVTAAQIHHHAHASQLVVEYDPASEAKTIAVEQDDDDAHEEYFAPACLEVERILTCDEQEVDMYVFARQRALNTKQQREEFEIREEYGEKGAWKRLLRVVAARDKQMEDTHDPENNVRYIVKWKGLPYAEITWESWKDIKREAVNQAEDFWHRQQAPPMSEVDRLMRKPHPKVKEFRKLKTSAVYGISSRERPVGEDGDNTMKEDAEESDDFKGFQLRSYQLEGVNWLLFNWWNKRSCILADEMGLGKTIQSATFLRELQTHPATEVRGPFLIVAPLSLVAQWQSELASWAPDMNVVLYHGSADARNFLVQHEFWFQEPFVSKQEAAKLRKNHVTKFNVLITTYEVILKDVHVFSKIRWKTLIVDEAHRLKNSKSRLFEDLATVPRDYCILLTGTPIANATEELWALLHFANADVFQSKDDFLFRFGQMTDAKQVKELHNLLKPYLLRRVKEDVEKSLPPKEETILEVTLTPMQKTFYKAIYERNTSFLFKGAKPSNAPSLMNVMMELRKCCNHPFLLKGAEERILVDAEARARDKTEADTGDTLMRSPDDLFEEQLVKSSGKMVLIEKLLRKLFHGGHKVLIFSQMVRVLDLLEELLKLKRYKFERLDGSTSSSSRGAAVDRFCRKNLQRFVMLLSTRAGGLGLNLTAADTVIIFDSDWNPQNDLQAMARAHRIGQTRAVRVYRLLTAKTYEMHMFHSASLKLGLERAVMSQSRSQIEENDDRKKTRKSEREAQAREIDELLKKGAYDVFRDEDDTEALQFMESDIDQLLESKSKTVTYGSASTQAIGSGLGSFSKASFVADTGDGEKDVDLDDPDFWSKAVGLDLPPEETPPDVAAMIDDGVKRARKQVKVFDPYAGEAEAEARKREKAMLDKQLENAKNKEEKLAKKPELKDQKQQEKIDKRRDKTGKASTKGESDSRPKKTKKNERLRALKRADNEDPSIERLRQAWEAPHRNRVAAAVIRFGFDRFCKVRADANLGSIPIQDVEIFSRCYIYQLSLQVAVSILRRFGQSVEDGKHVHQLLQQLLGHHCGLELTWICDAIASTMRQQLEVEDRSRNLRMPVILTEPSFVSDLQKGAALRSLRRIGIVCRVNRIIEDCLDRIIEQLGPHELGRRGCLLSDLPHLDADLKARFVTTDELIGVLGQLFNRISLIPPSYWWDWRCDVYLLAGTYIHGFSNYKAMREDPELPFFDNLQQASSKDVYLRLSNEVFGAASASCKATFDDALEAQRIKAELEVQAAIAAASKAAVKREEEAARLRNKGGDINNHGGKVYSTRVEHAFEFDGTDSHFVTLARVHRNIDDTLKRASLSALLAEGGGDAEGRLESSDDVDAVDAPECTSDSILYPMPDARVLDFRLLKLLQSVEEEHYDSRIESRVCEQRLWQCSDEVHCLTGIRDRVTGMFLGSNGYITEFSGIGFGASQCGIAHKTLTDGSDYAYGSANSDLAQIAYGTDSARYLRSIGVPMNITRYAVSALAYADPSVSEQMLKLERLRFLGYEASRRNSEQPKTDRQVPDPTVSSESKPVDQSSVRSLGDAPKAAGANGSNNEKEGAAASSAKGKANGGIPASNSMILPSEVTRIDPVTLMPQPFSENVALRGATCAAVLYYGYPTLGVTGKIRGNLIQLFGEDKHVYEQQEPFGMEDFRLAVSSLDAEVQVPPADVVQEYVESFLLPHCLRLCVHGNGPVIRNARGSEGKYETALGVGVWPEPSAPMPTPLPDPCISCHESSLEALAYANAILRRVRLLRACQLLCFEDSVDVTMMDQCVRSRTMGQLEGIPLWWCPWIHDLVVLVEAASRGLFGVRTASPRPCLLQESLLGKRFGEILEAHAPTQVRNTSEMQAFVFAQVRQFPSLFQLERRLALLCSLATSQLSEERFHLLPMFDHGGWPRN